MFGEAPISDFPFLFGGAFIEACHLNVKFRDGVREFPFLSGRAFIEVAQRPRHQSREPFISLPFRKGFH